MSSKDTGKHSILAKIPATAHMHQKLQNSVVNVQLSGVKELAVRY